jgi:hypothetical protein
VNDNNFGNDLQARRSAALDRSQSREKFGCCVRPVRNARSGSAGRHVGGPDLTVSRCATRSGAGVLRVVAVGARGWAGVEVFGGRSCPGRRGSWRRGGCGGIWVVIWAWPVWPVTNCRSEPPASSREAWAWRTSWTRTSRSTPDPRTACSQTRVRNVFREIGVPSRVANSRSSGPSRRMLIQSSSWSTRSAGRPCFGPRCHGKGPPGRAVRVALSRGPLRRARRCDPSRESIGVGPWSVARASRFV